MRSRLAPVVFSLLLSAQTAAQGQVSTIGIIKRAGEDSGCRSAWLMGTDPTRPVRFCLDLAATDAPIKAQVAALYDEEVAVEGHYVDGAVRLTALSTLLGARNGERPALDYHLDAVTTTRSHNLGARLRENPAARIRIQPPSTPLRAELIFQGVPLDADVAGLLEDLELRSGREILTPQAQMLGETLVLTLPPLAPGQLLRIQPADGDDLVALLTDGLFGGDRGKLSMTLLLTPGGHDTP